MDSDALSSKALGLDRGTGLAGIHCKAMGSRMRSRLGSKALAKEALFRRPQDTGQRGADQKGADVCADTCP